MTQEEPPRPGKLNPAIPRDLETIIVKAIAPNPAHRYQTAAELAEDLTCFLEDRPIRARRTTAVGRLWRWCRRNRAVAALAGTALALLIAVAVVASIGYVRTTRALERESHQRAQAELARGQAEEQRTRTAAEYRRAEANLRLATKAFEDIFSKVAADPIIQTPDSDSEDDEPWVPPAWEHAVTDKDAALLESLLKFYDQFAQQNAANVKLQKETARAYRRVGDIQRRLGQYEKAEAAYRHALESYQPLAQASPEDPESSTATAAIHNELGVVYWNTGRWAEARRAHQLAQEILGQQPPEVARLAESRFELARTYSFLSLMLPGPRPVRGNGPGARRPPAGWSGERAENNRKAVEILKQLIDEAPDNPRYRLAMARCQRDVLRIAPFSARADQAKQARQEAIGLLEQLVAEFPTNPEYRYELAETLAMGYPRWRDAAGSGSGVEPLGRAIDIGAGLVARYPSVPEYKAALGRWHVALGEVQRRAGALAEAEASLTQGVQLYERLVAELPSVHAHRFLLARSFHQLAEVQTARHEPDKARATLERAIANLEDLRASLSIAAPEGDSGMASGMLLVVSGMISWNYTSLAKVLRQLGEGEKADAATAKAQEAAAKAKEAAEPHGPPPFVPFRFGRDRPGPSP